MSYRPLRRTLLAGALVLPVAACSTQSGAENTFEAALGSDAEPVTGGTIDIGLDLELSDLDPAGNEIGQQSSLIVANAVYEPLFVDGPEGSMEPRLADSLTTEDTTEWVLTLKPDLTFSDGAALDAQAVIDHLTRIQETESAAAVPAAEIDSMEAADEVTIRFTLAAPNAAFDRYFSRNLGMIASTTSTDDVGNPLGAGPFVVTATEPGSSLTVERNESYAGEPAPADTIVFHFLPDSDSRFQSLQAGTMDMIWVQTPNHISTAEGEGMTTSVANATTATAIFNLERAPFDDLRVRQAIQAAIDREVLSEVVDQGLGGVSSGPLASNSRYDQNVEYPDFDPKRARTLLEEFGQPVALSYTTDSSPQSMQRATAIQQMLGEVGIEMEIDAADAATWGDKLFAQDFDLIEFVTSGYGDPDTVWALFETGSGSNFGGYTNPEVDDLTATATATADDEERSALYGDAARLIVEEAPTLFFTESPAGFAAAPEIGGLPDFSDRNVISALPGEFWTEQQ